MKNKFLLSDSDLTILRELIVCTNCYVAYASMVPDSNMLSWLTQIRRSEAYNSVSERILNLFDLTFGNYDASNYNEVLKK